MKRIMAIFLCLTLLLAVPALSLIHILEKVMETRDTSEREIASLMVGRDVLFGDLPGGQAAGEERLVIRGLCALGDRGLSALRGMDLTLSLIHI